MILTWILSASACGQEAISFRIIIDDQACAASASAPIELSLAALDSSNSSLCLLSQSTLGPNSLDPTLETGADPSAREVVLTAVVRSDPSCLACYGLLRLLLQPELTTYTLSLHRATNCAIPQAARDGLALPAGDLPPKNACP